MPRVELALAAVDDLDGLIRAHSLPPDIELASHGRSGRWSASR